MPAVEQSGFVATSAARVGEDGLAFRTKSGTVAANGARGRRVDGEAQSRLSFVAHLLMPQTFRIWREKKNQTITAKCTYTLSNQSKLAGNNRTQGEVLQNQQESCVE